MMEIPYTLQWSNMAMEHTPCIGCIGDVPSETPTSSGFPPATFDDTGGYPHFSLCQRVELGCVARCRRGWMTTLPPSFKLSAGFFLQSWPWRGVECRGWFQGWLMRSWLWSPNGHEFQWWNWLPTWNLLFGISGSQLLFGRSSCKSSVGLHFWCLGAPELHIEGPSRCNMLDGKIDENLPLIHLSLDSPQNLMLFVSMGWLKGKSKRNHRFSHEDHGIFL